MSNTNKTDLIEQVIDELTLPRNFHALRLSKHECTCFIEKCIRSMHMKKCVHLEKRQCGMYSNVYYVPFCIQDSFEYQRPNTGQMKCNGCPKNCRLYLSRKKLFFINIGIWLKSFPKICLRTVKKLASWYGSLHWITQCCILFTLLSLIKANKLIVLLSSLLANHAR